jgi:hypothetical protein
MSCAFAYWQPAKLNIFELENGPDTARMILDPMKKMLKDHEDRIRGSSRKPFGSSDTRRVRSITAYNFRI